MALLFTVLATVAALFLGLYVLSTAGIYFLLFVLHSLGWYIKSKTQGRREVILNRVRVENEEYESKRRRSPSGASGEDEEWEKVDATTCIGIAQNGEPLGDEWEGIIGFFHPFCNAGGGGERVLWAAVKATQLRWPKAICAIYTGDHEATRDEMLERVETRFNIRLHRPTIVLLYLSSRKYLMSSMYPYMTLLGQSLGSLVVAYDAFNLLVPDIYIDTMGYAFTIAFCKLLFPSVPTGAYVHYPTISTDMLASLSDETGLKGLNSGTGKGLRGAAKRTYWEWFAQLYGWMGGKADIVMCNSSWTARHINALWAPKRKTLKYRDPIVVFPPTAVSELESAIDVSEESELAREPSILYIAQFRPEKNHALILRAFARILHDRVKQNNKIKINHSDRDERNNCDNNDNNRTLPLPKLILIGSVRHSSPDETHIYNLRLLAHELRIRDHTTFLCDASWPTILSHLRTSSIGTNAMWNEHFGICVVEYQAAGLISVVHNSGGPREDIVIDIADGSQSQVKGDGGSKGATGFRASTEEEFSAAYEAALSLLPEEKVAMRLRARKSALRFTEEEFARKWIAEVEKLVEMV